MMTIAVQSQKAQRKRSNKFIRIPNKPHINKDRKKSSKSDDIYQGGLIFQYLSRSWYNLWRMFGKLDIDHLIDRSKFSRYKIVKMTSFVKKDSIKNCIFTRKLFKTQIKIINYDFPFSKKISSFATTLNTHNLWIDPYFECAQ